MNDERDRWLARRGLLCLVVAWILHAIFDVASFGDRSVPMHFLFAVVGFGAFSVAGAIRLFRSSPPNPPRMLLLLVAFAACAESTVLFFYFRSTTLRLFGGVSGTLLAGWVAYVYRARRYPLPLTLTGVAMAIGLVVGLLDTATRLTTGDWWLVDSASREIPNLRPVPTLVLAVFLVALLLDLRGHLATDIRAPGRPSKANIAPWRGVRGYFALYARIVLARLAIGVALAVALVAGADRALLPPLNLGIDVLFALVGAVVFSLVARQAPAARILALAAAGAQVFSAIVAVAVHSELVALAAIGSALACALVGAVGRDVGDARLPRLASDGLVTCVLGGIGVGALVWLAHRVQSGPWHARAAWAELMPLGIALPLAATFALVVVVRRVVYVLRGT